VQTPEAARRDTAKQYYSIGAGYLGTGEMDAAIKNLKRALTYDFDLLRRSNLIAWNGLSSAERRQEAENPSCGYQGGSRSRPKRTWSWATCCSRGGVTPAGHDLVSERAGRTTQVTPTCTTAYAEVFLKWNRKTSADSVYKRAIVPLPGRVVGGVELGRLPVSSEALH